jgi:hypothetical protein
MAGTGKGSRQLPERSLDDTSETAPDSTKRQRKQPKTKNKKVRGQRSRKTLGSEPLSVQPGYPAALDLDEGRR